MPTGGAWTEISSFTFEAGEYNSDKVKVSVRFEGIGKHPKENISVTFGKSQFDLKIMNWQGKNWRLMKTNLEKERERGQGGPAGDPGALRGAARSIQAGPRARRRPPHPHRRATETAL